jgi:RHS repeat-associated protein
MRCRYPYGEEITSTSNDTFKFAQTYRDSDSGVDYARTRYYASGIGRFLTVDSVGGHPKTPQTWNLYAYSDGDPVNMFDPQGRDGCWLDGVQVSCCVFTESKRLGRRSSFDPDPTHALDDEGCGDDGGPGGGGPVPPQLNCSFSGGTNLGASSGYYSPPGYSGTVSGWGDSLLFSYSASNSATGSYFWSDSQTGTVQGSIYTVSSPGGIKVNRSNTESLVQLGPGSPNGLPLNGPSANFFDSPAIPSRWPAGVFGSPVTSATVTWSYTLYAWVSDGFTTVPCPPVSWTLTMTIGEVGGLPGITGVTFSANPW